MFFMVRQFGSSTPCALDISVDKSGSSATTDYWRADDTVLGNTNDCANPGTGLIWIRQITNSGTEAANIVLWDLANNTAICSVSSASIGHVRVFSRGMDPDGSCYVYTGGGSGRDFYKVTPAGTFAFFTTAGTKMDSSNIAADGTGNVFGISNAGGASTFMRNSAINYVSHAATETLATGLGATPNLSRYLRNPNAISGRLYGWSPSTGISWVDPSTMAGTNIIASPAGGWDIRGLVGQDGNIYLQGSGATAGTVFQYDQDGSLITSLAVSGLTASGIGYDTSDGFLWVSGTTAGPVDAFHKIDQATLTIVDSIARLKSSVAYLDVIGDAGSGIPIVHTQAFSSPTYFGSVGRILCV